MLHNMCRPTISTDSLMMITLYFVLTIHARLVAGIDKNTKVMWQSKLLDSTEWLAWLVLGPDSALAINWRSLWMRLCTEEAMMAQ